MRENNFFSILSIHFALVECREGEILGWIFVGCDWIAECQWESGDDEFEEMLRGKNWIFSFKTFLNSFFKYFLSLIFFNLKLGMIEPSG